MRPAQALAIDELPPSHPIGGGPGGWKRSGKRALAAAPPHRNLRAWRNRFLRPSERVRSAHEIALGRDISVAGGNEDSMSWHHHRSRFVNDGGPLIVLADGACGAWTGSPDGDVSGDYARACEVGYEEVGAIEVADTHGVVIDVGSARWIVDGVGGRIVLAGCVCTEDGSDALLLRELDGLDEVGWIPVLDRMRVDGDLVLFHAAGRGLEFERNPVGERRVGIGDALSVPARRGDHVVEQRRLELADGSAYVLCRWTPVR